MPRYPLPNTSVEERNDYHIICDICHLVFGLQQHCVDLHLSSLTFVPLYSTYMFML